MNREGLLGDYDYGYLFIPRLPFTKRARKSAPFFGLDDRVPVVLALILGLQHALAMLAGGEYQRYLQNIQANSKKNQSFHHPFCSAAQVVPTSVMSSTSI